MAESAKDFLNRVKLMPVPRRLKPRLWWFIVAVVIGTMFYSLFFLRYDWIIVLLAKYTGIKAAAEVVSTEARPHTYDGKTTITYHAKIRYPKTSNTYSAEMELQKPAFDSVKPQDTVNIKYLTAFPEFPYIGQQTIWVVFFLSLLLAATAASVLWIRYEHRTLSTGSFAVAKMSVIESAGSGVTRFMAVYVANGQTVERPFMLTEDVHEEMVVFFNPEKPKNAIMHNANSFWYIDDRGV